MIMHRPDANTKHLGDLFIDVTFADIAEDFMLAICKLKNAEAGFSRRRILEEALEIIGHVAKNLGRREGMRTECPLDWFKQSARHAAAQEIPCFNAADGHEDLVASS